MSGLKEVLDETPPGSDTRRIRFSAGTMGLSVSYTLEYTLESPTRLSWVSVAGWLIQGYIDSIDCQCRCHSYSVAQALPIGAHHYTVHYTPCTPHYELYDEQRWRALSRVSSASIASRQSTSTAPGSIIGLR